MTTANVDFVHEPEPVASVIVLAWKSAPYLLDCLAALSASVHAVPYEVVLILNEPSPELLGLVDRHVTGAVTIRTRVNVGYGGAVNLGVARSRGEYVVLLNDDTEVMPGWLEALVETAYRRTSAGAVGSTTLFPDGTIQEAGCVIWADGSTVKVGRDLPGDSRQYDYERRVDFCSGTSLLIRRSCWDELGGMDSTLYFPAYYEDTDFCLRLKAAGYDVWYQPRSYVRHLESASTNSTYRSFLFARNRAIFVDRFADLLQERETPGPGDGQVTARAVWRAMGSPVRILFIDDQVANPAIGSGYPRMAELFTSLQRDGAYHLSLFTSLIEGADNNDLMCRLGVAVIDGSFEADLEAHLREPGVVYDVAVISRPHNYERFAPVIRATAPAVPIIYDAEALFHRRIERQAQMADDPDRRSELEAEAAAMRVTEAAIAADADHLVAISDEEAAFLAAHARGPVDIHGPLLEGIAPGPAGFEGRSDVGYVAGWAGGATSPNADALLWFAREVMPRVTARVPGARLFVTGGNPPEAALRVAGPSVIFTGSLEDLGEFYGERRVIVVPMRYGAGVKNKTVEALQYGVPTVSTRVGAEGVPVDDDGLLVSDDAASFAIRIASLLSDRDAWELQRRRILAQQRRWRDEDPVWPRILRDTLRSRRFSRSGRR